MPIICAASAHAHHNESLLSFTPRQPWLWNALTIPILQMRSRTIKEIKIRPKISEGMKITEAALNPDVLASVPHSEYFIKAVSADDNTLHRSIREARIEKQGLLPSWSRCLNLKQILQDNAEQDRQRLSWEQIIQISFLFFPFLLQTLPDIPPCSLSNS